MKLIALHCAAAAHAREKETMQRRDLSCSVGRRLLALKTPSSPIRHCGGKGCGVKSLTVFRSSVSTVSPHVVVQQQLLLLQLHSFHLKTKAFYHM